MTCDIMGGGRNDVRQPRRAPRAYQEGGCEPEKKGGNEGRTPKRSKARAKGSEPSQDKKHTPVLRIAAVGPIRRNGFECARITRHNHACGEQAGPCGSARPDREAAKSVAQTLCGGTPDARRGFDPENMIGHRNLGDSRLTTDWRPDPQVPPRKNARWQDDCPPADQAPSRKVVCFAWPRGAGVRPAPVGGGTPGPASGWAPVGPTSQTEEGGGGKSCRPTA